MNFVITNKDGIDILKYDSGACRPATSSESGLWNRLTEAEEVIRLAADPENWHTDSEVVLMARKYQEEHSEVPNT